MRYIGCNYNNGVRYGSIDSSFNGKFKDELVLIENGISDITPCIIGDISEAYIILESKLTRENNPDFERVCSYIYETIDEYFGGIKNIHNRMSFYKTIDDIKNPDDIDKVANLKNSGAAMCVERAMLAQNLLFSLGFKSFYKCSGIINNGKKEVHSYNLVENNNEYYIFDSSIPTIIDDKINPLIAKIPKEIYDIISNPKNDTPIYSVQVSHYNPIRGNNIEITYNSGKNNIYYVENKDKNRH